MDRSFSSSTWLRIIVSQLISVTRHHLIPQLVLPLIPITALVIQNGVTMNTLMSYSSRCRYPGISTLYLISTLPESPPSGGRSAAPWRLQSSSRTSRSVAPSSWWCLESCHTGGEGRGCPLHLPQQLQRQLWHVRGPQQQQQVHGCNVMDKLML